VRAPGNATRDAMAGAGSFTVIGRFDGVALTPGAYELIATPVSGGRSGKAQALGFSITR
jgi:hypothetical protein